MTGSVASVSGVHRRECFATDMSELDVSVSAFGCNGLKSNDFLDLRDDRYPNISQKYKKAVQSLHFPKAQLNISQLEWFRWSRPKTLSITFPTSFIAIQHLV
jgi:hypothetical protein